MFYMMMSYVLYDGVLCFYMMFYMMFYMIMSYVLYDDVLCFIWWPFNSSVVECFFQDYLLLHHWEYDWISS